MKTCSDSLCHATGGIPGMTSSRGFQSSPVVGFCQTVLCGRWVGFYEKRKSADKTKTGVPLSFSPLLKPTDGVGREGGLTRSSGNAEGKESTSKRRLSRGQQWCQVQREMKRGKPELCAPCQTKTAVSGTKGKSGSWLEWTHGRQAEDAGIWQKEFSLWQKRRLEKNQSQLSSLAIWISRNELGAELQKGSGSVHHL